MKFHKWEVAGAEERMGLQSLCDDKNGLIIVMEGEFVTCRIIFESYLAYKNEDESYKLSLWGSEVWEKNPERLWNFFTVSESEYLEEIHNQSCNIYRDRDIFHYAIYTGMDCVDILSYEEDPIIEIIEK